MGRALIIIIFGFTTIFSGIIFNVSSTQQFITSDINKIHERWIAQNAAESITNVMMSKIYQTNFTATDTFYLDGLKGYVDLTNITGDSVTEASKWLLEAIVEHDNVKDTTRTVFIYPAYSHYYYLLHGPTWPAHITYADFDTLDGPIYSDPPIKISGSPVFLSKVASIGANFAGAGTPKTYGGVEFNTISISPPNASVLSPIITVANEFGHVFTSTSVAPDTLYLNFKADSTYQWSVFDGGANGSNKTSDYNGIIMTQHFTGRFHIKVKGVVNGQITIISDRDIIIDSSFVCHNNPKLNPNSQDFIGLIATHDIIIPYNGNTNITIQAALLADNKMKVKNWNVAPYRGDLTIYGSIAVQDEDQFGNPTTTGFNKVHEYDPRFRDRTPPYFPRVSKPTGVSPYNRKEILYRSN